MPPNYGSYDGLPVRWHDNEAWMFFKGHWCETSAADCDTAAALLTAEQFHREFGQLPKMPKAAFQSSE
jgi:hypothetical protein